MRVHSSVVMVVSVVAMATGAKKQSKTEENGNFCDTKVCSTPYQHASGRQYGYLKLPCSLLDTILYDYNIFGSEVQSFENDD